MNRTSQADVIKIAAVITAAPRWVGALLASEGIALPDSWEPWWIPLSALLGAAMALVEGWSFAYVFNSWRNQTDKRANRLLWMAALSAVTFILVLAPYIDAQVRDVTMTTVLGTSWGRWLWNIAVPGSTIVIVASVGYAQKASKPRKSAKERAPVPAWKLANTCWCGWQPVSEKDVKMRVIAHRRRHVNEMKDDRYETAMDAFEGLKRRYPVAFDDGNEPVTITEVAQVREG